MKVSIVTISYNQARYLEQCILSVLHQSYPDVEYILVDPGSTDGSRDVIEKYRAHITSVILDPDDGPADGLNKGFQNASGDVFGFLNSDDILFPNAVSQIVQAFRKNPDAAVISGHGIVINEDGRVCKRVFSHRFGLKAYAYGACTLVQQASFFKRDQFLQVGGFNPVNHISWDGELWVDLALNGAKFSRIHTYLANFRIYENSITGSREYREKLQKEHLRICEKIGINPRSKLQRKAIWLFNRLSDPLTTALRLLDGFKISSIELSAKCPR